MFVSIWLHGFSCAFHIFPSSTANERQVRNPSRDNRWDMPVSSNLSFRLLSWISVFLSKALFLYYPSILNSHGKTGKQPDLPGDMRLFAIPFLSHIGGYATGDAATINLTKNFLNHKSFQHNSVSIELIRQKLDIFSSGQSSVPLNAYNIDWIKSPP